MKKIRIRKFTLLSFFLILTLPWLFYVATHFFVTKTFNFGIDDSQKENVETTIHLIEDNIDNWTNPVWQNQISKRLEAMNINVLIRSKDDSEIFRTKNEKGLTFTRSEQFSIILDGNVIGRVVIYQANSKMMQMIMAFIGLLLAFIIVGVLMRQSILMPLEKMSQSAREIAKGNLDVKLSTSRIAEIAEVREGFKVMVEGLNKSFQKQMKLEEERRFVIAAVAHDLRTPLFALRGYLEGLEKGIADSPEKVAKYLAVCKEKSAQLDRLVEELFAFTKTEFNDRVLKEKEDLGVVLKKSISSLSLSAQEKHIMIEMDNLMDECTIMGDSHLLERAMTNILDNAVRHTPYDGKINVECYGENQKVKFSIHDTGEGFISDELQRVFEPLFRSEVSRSRSTGGVGLGLTISQRIIKLHGGELVVENHPDGGGIVKGWLPFHKES